MRLILTRWINFAVSTNYAEKLELRVIADNDLKIIKERFYKKT